MSDTFNMAGNTFHGPTAMGSGAHAEQHGPTQLSGLSELRLELDEIQRLLRDFSHHLDNPELLDQKVSALRGELEKPHPDRSVVVSGLNWLTVRVAAVSGLAEAVTRACEIAVKHWLH
jgi:hypothetical protein